MSYPNYSYLKLQLMATGQNSGTWGNVTNVNLEAVEEAITGSSDVTFASNNQTLSASNTNSSQTFRNLRLNLIGTTGGATRTLTVPDIEKVYIVNNTCGDAVQVQNSTGSNISVPAGKTMYLFSTGSNVVDAVTHLTSLTLATPLPIASGGTGSNATAYSNLASNVFGVLPIANGGTGSNAGPNVSTVSGVLPVLNGGTGSNIASFSGANITSLNATNISTGELVVSRGGTGANSLTANSVLLGNGTSSILFVSPGTSGNVLTSNGTTWTSAASGGITAGTYTLLNNTVVDFTGIPSTAKRITIMIEAMSTTGTSVPIIRVGAGGIISGTGGYPNSQISIPTGANPGGTANSTGFPMNNSSAATNALSGTAVLTRLIGGGGVNKYSYTAMWGTVDGSGVGTRTMLCAGSIDTGASPIDTIRLTTVSGSDTFDNGYANILYE
jgi:hypothetical protein